MKTEKSSKFFLIVTFILIFIMAARTPIDTDLWWHLRAGEETIHTSIPVTKDYFSFTRFNQTWINHSWLSQVILYLIYDVSGFTGLSLFMVLNAVLAMWVVSKQMSGKAVTIMVLLLFGGMVASVNWVPRPQIVSLFFLSLTAWFLQRYQRKPDKWIWLLPVIFMLWGNFHGGYALGLILVGCVLAAMILNHYTGESRTHTWSQIGRLFAAGILGYLTTAINPNGIEMLVIPFRTVGVSGLQDLVSEWASPDFHQPLQIMFLVYFFLAFWLLTLAKKPHKLEDLITISVFAVMAFLARRNIGPFVIVSLPIMANLITSIPMPVYVDEWMRKWINRLKRNEIQPGIQKLINCIIICLLILVSIVKLIYVTESKWMDKTIRQYYPLDAIEWTSEHLKPSRVMSEYNWGGFIEWKLKDFPVFIDGRTDLFGDVIIGEWMDVMQCQSNTEQILGKWDIHVLLVEKNKPVTGCLISNGWQIVYQDDQSVILTDGDAVIK